MNDIKPDTQPTQDKDPSARLRSLIQDKYGQVARQATHSVETCCEADEATVSTCCTGGGTTATSVDPVTTHLYTANETECLPTEAVEASRGCGNPAALASLAEGEIVLDLGSGGGIDVLLAAQRVGPTGKVYGLDMTEDMLELARRNQAAAGVANAEFRQGEIENIPLPDASVDVIISNCVINLSTDKPRALAEAFRVLRPGGRLAVSDIIVRGAVDIRIRESIELWLGCVAGALEEEQYRGYLMDAGFVRIEIEPTRIYDPAQSEVLLASLGEQASAIARTADSKFMSAFVRAEKPRN